MCICVHMYAHDGEGVHVKAKRNAREGDARVKSRWEPPLDVGAGYVGICFSLRLTL